MLRNPLLPYDGDTPRASGISADSARVEDASSARASAIAAVSAAVRSEEARLREIAIAALSAPANPEEAFEYLNKLTRSPETGVVVEDGSLPLAWAGQIRTITVGRGPGTFASFSPFYTTLQVIALKGGRRVVATALIHAEPPSNRVATALVDALEARGLVESFRFVPPSDTAGGVLVADLRGRPLMRMDAVPRAAESVQFAQSAAARGRGVALLGFAILTLIALGWSDRRSLGSRLFSVAIGLISIALIPLNNFSNYSRIFDPAYFYSPAGGPLMANAGSFAMMGVLLVLGVIAIIRARRTRLNHYLAGVSAIALFSGGMLMAEVAAGGIVLPPWGASMSLWLTWEVPLFLLLFATWLAGVWLARIALGREPMVKLSSAAFIAVVAASVATFIVWTKTTEQRLQLAMRDVAGLQRVDGDVALLLTRFGAQLSGYETPGTRADLLKHYAVSDLASAEVQVSLGIWSPEAFQTSRLDLAQLPYDSAALSGVVRDAIAARAPIVRQTLGPVGRQVFLAVPHGDAQATSAVASPRTRLVAQDPYAALLGFEQVEQSDPPYTLTLAAVLPDSSAKQGTMTWRRLADEWHGDEIIATSNGLARAHVEVDLRSWPTRLVHALLIIILDIAIAGLVWSLSAIVEGGFIRWLRGKGSTWVRSYHGRLTLALFAFFVVPAVAFAAWSYQRLRGDDRRVRELLARETLNPAAGEDLIVHQLHHTPGETPVFLYSGTYLTSSSDSLYEMIAPAGRLLPRPVQLSIADGELIASWQQTIANSRIVWGFRAMTSPARENYVLAAPARTDEVELDRRRRDLTLLVLFATAMGGIAAFWLSGIAARVLARDLELSRIEVARAERVLAWGEMARQVAHEIKNPLTPIRLGVQHLRRARSDSRIDFDKVLDENVTRILSEIDRLDEIARAFSRYGSAPGDLPGAEEVDVAAILRDVIGLEKIGIGGVSWVLRGAEEPTSALARTDELRDVLLNVFENSRLARAREVTIDLARTTDKTVTISIADDGAGIPQSAMPRVFEPHFSTRTTGSGLGLAISRRLLESWGGTIDLTSEEGGGARVLITLRTTAA